LWGVDRMDAIHGEIFGGAQLSSEL
jgi:hypothetical protein